MSKKIIAAYTNNPRMGLGNRITMICAGYAAAKISGSEFVSCWERGKGCDANWSDLFKPSSLFETVDTMPSGAYAFKEPSFPKDISGFEHKQLDMDAGNHKKYIGMDTFTPEYWQYYRECAQSIELVDELALPNVSDFISVSIRSNWGLRAPKRGWWERAEIPDGCFICSDSEKAFSKIDDICDEYWYLSKPTCNKDLQNRDLESIKDAARDMVMLTRSKLILAIGPQSTFRNLAVLGYGVPIFKFSETFNP